jgi:UDP-N-acetylglucosamine 2-epimerase (non-hydrolysing)/GDP/UDP-N,N'-diacetylbacillosamine 2-epimerase (hydrolysing)
MKKICVVTGSRADYGLLSRLMSLIKEDSELCLQIVATNMHLSPEFGLTYKEIENDGFKIDRKVEILLSSDTQNATTKSVGLALIGLADAYEYLKPDLLLVLGDRYEILASVITALFYRIPVAHLHGGELTEGAYDDAIRHSITKMSHLHFTSTEEYRNRVIQLGEDPGRVFNVGAIGIDNIEHLKLLSKPEIEENLKFQIGYKCVLITFHPVTLDRISSEEQITCLLKVLESIPDLRVIFTYPNSDTSGHVIIDMINQFVLKNNSRSTIFSNLGHIRYLSLLQYITAVVGNSSSGIIEVPYFGIPTLNIGNRQQGRLRAGSVVDCEPTFSDIHDKLLSILSLSTKSKLRLTQNPYYKKGTANEVLEIIKKTQLGNLVKKAFYKL